MVKQINPKRRRYRTHLQVAPMVTSCYFYLFLVVKIHDLVYLWNTRNCITCDWMFGNRWNAHTHACTKNFCWFKADSLYIWGRAVARDCLFVSLFHTLNRFEQYSHFAWKASDFPWMNVESIITAMRPQLQKIIRAQSAAGLLGCHGWLQIWNL